MTVPDYPSNNKDASEEEIQEKDNVKKIDKVVNGKVVRRKKTKWSQFSEKFEGAWEYVAKEVLIPAAKDMLSDAVAQGTDSILFDESRNTTRPRRRSSGHNGHVSYNRYSSSSPSKRREPVRQEPTISGRARATHDFDEILLATRIEAEEVIDRLYDLINQYDTASVADLYELVGIQGKYTDARWGWFDLRGTTARRTRRGYLLDLPAPEYLD